VELLYSEAEAAVSTACLGLFARTQLSHTVCCYGSSNGTAAEHHVQLRCRCVCVIFAAAVLLCLSCRPSVVSYRVSV
jgi:hypothetical protein